VPVFTANQEWAKVGWPYATWYVDRPTASPVVAIKQDWSFELLFGPLESELEQYQLVFWPGYEYYITDYQARKLTPLNVGCVKYVDDFNDEWSDFYVYNPNYYTPGTCATQVVPIGVE